MAELVSVDSSKCEVVVKLSFHELRCVGANIDGYGVVRNKDKIAGLVGSALRNSRDATRVISGQWTTATIVNDALGKMAEMLKGHGKIAADIAITPNP